MVFEELLARKCLYDVKNKWSKGAVLYPKYPLREPYPRRE